MLAGVLAVVLALAAWVCSTQSAAADPGPRTRSWGDNAFGELGDGTFVERHTPVTVAGLTGAEVRAVSAGGASLAAGAVVDGGHVLARLGNGRVEAWGLNNHGQLGDGTTTSHATPGVVAGLATVKAVSAGGAHSLALLNDGTVRAWGSDADGQLGNDTALVGALLPTAVAGLTGVKAISAGGDHSLALRSDGTVWAWGDDDNGQLGNDTPLADSPVPVQVPGLVNATAISAGSNHSAVLVVPPATRTTSPPRQSATGTVKSFGDDAFGQLGNDDALVDSPVPVTVLNQSGVKAISAGADHTVALIAPSTGQATGAQGQTSGGTVRAWGSNDHGEIGDGSTTDRPTPVTVQTAIKPTSIDAGSSFSLAS